MKIEYKYKEYPYSPRATRASMSLGSSSFPLAIVSAFLFVCLMIPSIQDMRITVGCIFFYFLIRIDRILMSVKERFYAVIDIEKIEVDEAKMIRQSFKQELRIHILYIVALPVGVLIGYLGVYIENSCFVYISWGVYVLFKVGNRLLLKLDSKCSKG